MAKTVEIYTKSRPQPITLEVESVQTTTTAEPPSGLRFTTKDGEEGTIYLARSEIEAVIITPEGTSTQATSSMGMA